jgi:putative ABC transport system ATP-binding protein
VSVEGPSGCGKTTLLNLLGLLDEPTGGTVRWDGRSVGRLPERERARRRLTGVGFIFQRFYLLPTLTAAENVALPMRGAGVGAAARASRAAALLESVGLTGRARARPHELSGGEEQRVAIARALANDPGLLLADEPTGELDRANTESVLDLLVDAQRRTGATLVLVTHNPQVAVRARRHLTMADGRIVGDVREL